MVLNPSILVAVPAASPDGPRLVKATSARNLREVFRTC